MANKIMKNEDGGISVRLDGVYILNGKYLVEPFVKVLVAEDGTEKTKQSFFGSFKFFDEQEARYTLKEAVKKLNAEEDTVFDGTYPKWVDEDINYGTFLNCSNKVKFCHLTFNPEDGKPIFNVFDKEEEVTDYSYSIELTLTETKSGEHKGKIYMRVNRAIAMEKIRRDNDELFDDMDLF